MSERAFIAADLDVVKRAYANCLEDDGYFSAPSDYDPMVRTLPGYIVFQISDSDYSGDTWVLLQREGKFGWLAFGWGSCSGCDSLQACDSYEDLAELRNKLARETKWGTAEEMAAYLTAEQRRCEWDFGQGKAARAAAAAYLTVAASDE